MAAILLTAAATMGGTEPITDRVRRRRDDAIAESSTAETEVDPLMLQQVRELFDLGASEFFHDGMHSRFSRTLLRMLAGHGRPMLQAIAEYLFSGIAKTDVAAEALQRMADFDDPSTLLERWALLQASLRDRSPQIRDAAILAFAAMDDPRARQHLVDARDREQIRQLRRLIDKVIAQLERIR